MGNLEIYVGINGTGKSTEIKKKYEEKILDAIFIDSEFKNSDEYKVAKNGAVLSEIFVNKIFNKDINTIIDNLKSEIDKNIKENFINIEEYFEEINAINDSSFNKNLFPYKSNDNKEFILNFLTNQTKIDGDWGSGQKRLFFLKMLEDIDANNIFIDEPELYCHPNLIKTISQIIFTLLEKGKNVYITTHSPKLLQYLVQKNFNFFENITFFNKKNKFFENNINMKNINIKIENILKDFIIKFHITDELLTSDGTFKYYKNDNFWNFINTYTYINFFECLFSDNIFLVEGKNDKIFLEYFIKENNLSNKDYSICDCDGKYNMPIFYEIFKKINKNVFIIFDKDKNNTKNIEIHNLINEHLDKNNENNKFYFNFNIEKDLGYKENKSDIVKFISFLETGNINDNKFKIKDKIISFFNLKNII
ncbi:ATP-dependent nuclease [Spiroplasma citri]|uniref:ATP-dependent nuclease n=1 Tax=Spiroplasma citri TaxID=2133 RepID=UPI0011BB7F8C|nr:TOPRIM nucleotidyl transferase/hydrolase domain-containing protein [Spiroplasma citri]QED25160.1 AAA family ATPase [Spiroplasma citri]